MTVSQFEKGMSIRYLIVHVNMNVSSMTVIYIDIMQMVLLKIYSHNVITKVDVMLFYMKLLITRAIGLRSILLMDMC